MFGRANRWLKQKMQYMLGKNSKKVWDKELKQGKIDVPISVIIKYSVEKVCAEIIP